MTTVGTSVAERLKNLRERVAAACVRSGRSTSSVRILAVSKFQSEDLIREAALCGQMDFGENYTQEACTKLNTLDDLALRWHFIGRIQSNKIKNLVGRYSAIHSVDRLSVAQQLNRLSSVYGCVQDVFLQFNVADEASKGGAGEAELVQLFDHCRSASNLRLLGLMVMPPLGGENRVHFSRTRELLGELGSRLEPGSSHPWNQLSMGTSGDFEVAIEEGSTFVRVGTDIFGARPVRVE